MKRFFSMLTVIFMVIGLAAACGGGDSQAGDTANKPAQKGGEVFENDFFKVTLQPGWTVFDDSKVKMMRIYPKNDTSIYAPTIHLKFEGNGNWAGTPEESINSMASNYKGTAPQQVTINNIQYYKTTYEYGGQKQTMMVTEKDGNKITVTLVGKGYDTNPDIPKILDTLSYK
jgi:hypothetical protein